MDVSLDGLMDGCKNRWMAALMDGLMDNCMIRRMAA